tara:strand:+ start:2544 stop:3035 length:492 start_codon:yes stop_codon:yes gene_type:complete
MKKVVFLLLGILSLILACTRDDICTPETSKTPLLIIKFFNAENPEAPKSVNALTVFRPQDEFSLFAPVTADSIALPLDTSADFTEYFFVSNANDSIPLADFITFTYSRQDEFINRACAFRTNFRDLDLSLDNPTSQSWIDEIIIRTDSVNARNQNEAHLFIFH